MLCAILTIDYQNFLQLLHDKYIDVYVLFNYTDQFYPLNLNFNKQWSTFKILCRGNSKNGFYQVLQNYEDGSSVSMKPIQFPISRIKTLKGTMVYRITSVYYYVNFSWGTMVNRITSVYYYVNFHETKNGFKAAGITDALEKLAK